MKKLTSLVLSAALVASLAISASAFASGTGDPADTVWDYPYYKTTATAPSQTGASNKEGPASFAVDGDSSSYWHSRWGNSGSGDTDLTNLADKRYIQLELEEEVEVTGLRYLPRPSTGDGDTNGIVTQYRVEVSTTGEDGSWKQVASGTWSNSDRNWKVATFETPTQAKYVRLYGVATAGDSANKFMSCGELRVQTTQVPVENIFLGKTASASSHLSGQEAGKANDENGATKWCADWTGHSSDYYAMEDNWWQVDLGWEHRVDTLTLLFETSAQWKYHVAVSNDPTFADYTIPENEITTVTASKAVVNVGQTGRYVRVYLKTDTQGRWPCLWDVYATGSSIDLKPDLQALVEEADSMQAEWYTQGWDAYLQAVNTGKALLEQESPDHAALTQAIADIKAAKEALVEREQYTAGDPFVFPSQPDVTATLEAEFGELQDVKLSSDGQWYLQVASNSWASHGKFLNCFNQQDTVTYYYNAPVAGTYSVTATYRSGSASNQLAWSGDKIQAGTATAGASDDASQNHEVTFDLVVTQAGAGTLVFTGPDTKSPQLDKLDISLKQATYTVTVNTATGGTASANVTNAAPGTEVTLTAQAAQGYHFKEWQVQGDTVTITENKFTMPQGNVTITPVFEAHTYGYPEFHWAEDGKSATATFTCDVCNDAQNVEAEVTTDVVIPATCTEMGESRYTGTVIFGGKDYTATKNITDIPALGHNYGEPTFVWTDDNTSVTATFTCDRDGCGHQETATAQATSAVTKQPTCTDKGETTYSATVEFGGKEYPVSKTEANVEALGHHYGQPTFAWADDNTSVTATFTCDRDGCGHQETATAQATSAVTKQPTCEDKGETTYSATVEFGGKQYPVSKTEANVPALGHHYGDPAFAWAQDNTSVTATFTCDRDGCGHQETATAQATFEVTKQPTCTEKGETTYSATVEFGGKQYPVSKTEVNVPALGHNYGEPTFVWAEDNTSVTATFTCDREGCGHQETATAQASSEVTKQPTCTDKGETTYSATVEFGEKQYPVSKTEANVPALGHHYGEPTFAWAEDNTSVTATFTCDRDGCGHQETATATATSEVTKQPTCEEMGETTYSATVEFGEKQYPVSKTEANVAALGHHYGEPTFVWAEDNSSVTATFTCDREGCGHQETATAQASSEVTKQPTCTDKGETTYSATVEFGGKQYPVSKTEVNVAALGHKTELQNTKDVTCTQDGYTGDLVCTVCGTVVEEGKVIKATGHDYVDGVCTVCGAEDPDHIKPSDPVTGDKVTVDNNSAVHITASNADQVFDKGTVINVESVVKGEVYNTVEKALKDLVADMKHTAILDITATLDGKAVQPNGKVQMTFQIPENLTVDNLKLFYVSDDGKTTEEIAITVNKDARTVTANLEHFSTYVLANVKSNQAGTQVPPTGDEHQLMAVATVLLTSMGAFAAVTFVEHKRRNR